MENQEVQGTIDISQYKKFISLAVAQGTDPENPTFTFDLEGFAKLIDVAYIEGRMAEITDYPEYVNDRDKMDKYTLYNAKLDEALGYQGHMDMELEPDEKIMQE